MTEQDVSVLRDLGVEVDIDERANGIDGTPLPDSYHPFLSKTRSLVRTSELFVVGIGLDEKNVLALDDLTSGPDAQRNGDNEPFTWDGNAIKQNIDESLNGRVKGGVAADINGDGKQEVVVVLHDEATNNLTVRVYSSEDGISETEVRSLAVNGVSQPQAAPDLAAGDVDNDGADEVAITWSNDSGQGFLWILDDESGGYSTLYAQTYEADVVRVALGDPDSDGFAEIGVVYGLSNFDDSGVSNYILYDDKAQEFASLKEGVIQGQDGETLYTAVLGDIAFGDVDGDRIDEVLLGGLENGSDDIRYVGLTLDDGTNDYVTLNTTIIETSSGVSHRAVFLETLDIDGDLVDEVLFNNILFEDFSSEFYAEIGRIPGNQFGDVFYDRKGLSTGDLDADQKDDIVWFDHEQRRLRVYAFKAGVLQSIENVLMDADGDKRWPLVVATNFDTGDQDNVTLEYTGEHTVVFSEPDIIAVLAAAPCQGSFGQDFGNDCSTSFGQASEVSSEVEQSVGVSFGLSIGVSFSAGLIVRAFEQTLKFSVENQTDFISTYFSSLETGVTYVGGGNEDTVIFTAVPQDMYKYEIIDHSDAALIGEFITVGVPRPINTYKVTRSFYNDNNGDYPDVDETILTHTEGMVSSYPGLAERDATLDERGGVMSREATVGQGSGAIVVFINEAQGEGSGVATSLSAVFESETIIGTALLGFSAGIHYSYDKRLNISETTSFEGEVADIPSDTWADNRFNFGLFVYPFENERQSFTVVQYWVD